MKVTIYYTNFSDALTMVQSLCSTQCPTDLRLDHMHSGPCFQMLCHAQNLEKSRIHYVGLHHINYIIILYVDYKIMICTVSSR